MPPERDLEIDEDLEVNEEEELEDEDTPEPEQDSEEGGDEDPDGENDDTSGDDDEELVITLGDDEIPDNTPAPEWVRELRKNHREVTKRNRELEIEVERLKSPKPTTKVGPKPTLSDPDIEYDTDKFEAALLKWQEARNAADREAAAARKAQEEQDQQWQARLEEYGKERDSLKVGDFQDSEDVVLEKFNETQQGILVQGSDNPARLVYALGKYPDKVDELAKIKDPVKFAFAVSKLEAQVKTASKKKPPSPERRVQGTGATGGAVDSQLKRLREEAERTGDYTKIHQYKKQKRAASK